MLHACREDFPKTTKDLKLFEQLWYDHGIEVANKPMKLDLPQYRRIEKDGRLIWVVARNDGLPIGYSCHIWYRDRHFDERIAADDIWYVKPAYRKSGIGRNLKEIGLLCLKDAGVIKTYDLIRDHGPWQIMEDMGYTEWGTRWIRIL